MGKIQKIVPEIQILFLYAFLAHFSPTTVGINKHN